MDTDSVDSGKLLKSKALFSSDRRQSHVSKVSSTIQDQDYSFEEEEEVLDVDPQNRAESSLNTDDLKMRP